MMTPKQQANYDKTCQKIRDILGSYNNIALQAFQISDEKVTGETVRIWFTERRIPAEFVFLMYEITDSAFDPFALLPWLKRWVILKKDFERAASRNKSG